MVNLFLHKFKSAYWKSYCVYMSNQESIKDFTISTAVSQRKVRVKATKENV